MEQNSQLGAADYTKLDSNLSSVMFKDKALSLRIESFVSLDSSTQRHSENNVVYGSSIHMCRNVFGIFSNLLVQACVHKMPCISETEPAIGVKLKARLVVLVYM